MTEIKSNKRFDIIMKTGIQIIIIYENTGNNTMKLNF